jgi:hypothetical protein
MLFAWAQDEEEGAIIDFHSITKLEKEEFPVQTGGASFFTPAGLPIHFADMSKMGEMYFTTDKVNDCFDSELKPTDCQSGENHIISDKGILIAFRYNGAFYTPIIRASDKSFPGAIKASDNFFVGYKAENYYSEEYTPENTSFDVYWYQGEWNGTIPFCFDKNAYINANAFNKEEYKGAGYFATFMERRTSYSCDDYLMTLKELDKLDFFNSTLSAQYNPWGNGGLLQSIEDREDECRLVYSVENENGRKEHYEYDYVLEDWVSIDIATAGFSAYMDLDLIAEITNLYGHQTLDILGFIPLAGEAFDVVNGMWYLVEGDGGNATLCFASMLPIVGDAAVKSSKYAIKIIKGRKLQKLFDLTDESLLAYGRIAKTLQQGGDITCRECLELSGKLLAHKPGKAAAIEKLATRITDSDQLKTVLIKVDEMGTTQKGKFLDDVGQIDDVAKFDGGLLDAWKKMDNLGADDALRQNTGALEVLDLKAKGELDKIPDPSEYLDADYISNHLAKFDEGIGRVSTRANYNEFGTLGGPNSFILPESELRQILNETGGNVRKIEKRLGMHEGDLGDNPVFGVFERESVGEIKMPSGREGGADKDLWIPGGKTSGGTTEAVVDLSENTTFLLID